MPEKETTDLGENPAVEVAKERAAESDGMLVLSTGVRVRFKAVSGILIQEVILRVKDPEVPKFYNEEKDREEPNPLDPGYLKALERTERERILASMDALVLFGVELVDGMPEDDAWVRKLKYLGIEFDEQDSFEREFAYKRFIALGASDLPLLTRAAGVTEEGLRQAAAAFPSMPEGGADRGSGDQGLGGPADNV